MSELVQPPRGPFDGPISVGRHPDGRIFIRAETLLGAGLSESVDDYSCVSMSEHNAWRVFGALALVLGIPLSPRVAKAITL